MAMSKRIIVEAALNQFGFPDGSYIELKNQWGLLQSTFLEGLLSCRNVVGCFCMAMSQTLVFSQILKRNRSSCWKPKV